MWKIIEKFKSFKIIDRENSWKNNEVNFCSNNKLKKNNNEVNNLNNNNHGNKVNKLGFIK